MARVSGEGGNAGRRREGGGSYSGGGDQSWAGGCPSGDLWPISMAAWAVEGRRDLQNEDGGTAAGCSQGGKAVTKSHQEGS